MTKRYDELSEELGAVSVEIAKVSSKLATASSETMRSAISKLGELETQKHGLTLALNQLRNQEAIEQEAAEATRKKKAAEKVNQILEYFSKARILCPVDHPMKFVGPKRPNGSGLPGQSWKTVDTPYLLGFDCGVCNTRFLRSPSEMLELEKKSQSKKESKRKFVTGAPDENFNVG